MELRTKASQWSFTVKLENEASLWSFTLEQSPALELQSGAVFRRCTFAQIPFSLAPLDCLTFQLESAFGPQSIEHFTMKPHVLQVNQGVKDVSDHQTPSNIP